MLFFACTSGSFIYVKTKMDHLISNVDRKSNVKIITASNAIVSALKHLKIGSCNEWVEGIKNICNSINKIKS